MPEGALFTAAEYAALADQQVGKPYVLGANGPLRFDCSGLVLWLNNRSGALPMGDDTAAGIYNRTKAVTAGAEKVGDLVFLRNNPARSNGIGHIAVLTQKLSNGDWRIIEARGRAYGVVRTTLSYWGTRRYYTGVRRLPAFRLATSTPAPAPTLDALDLRVATFNCSDPRFGDPLTPARERALAATVVAAKADVYLLTEAPSAIRYVLRDAMPGGRARWLVWERGTQAIMFDKHRFSYAAGDDPITFGPTDYHGGDIAELVDRATGRTMIFGAYHLPPNKVASLESQARYVDAFTAAMRKHDGVRIIGGDGMDKPSWADGWIDVRSAAAKSSTRNAATYKTSVTDRVQSDPETPVVWRGYNVKQSGIGSDHNLVITAGTIPAGVSSN
ncbi:MAG: C40 family peptidase [Tessaracoccus sp.]|uniref:NlpC/P60 family protein n=1 Tax=Tessaracoccus sp. TaxID=1971211 RepID=UPI001ECEDA02|nr:NlpC/P60 family protein [Tessaracoccus sp.]MBK7823561.1 C40 family peptidase [Tessaracoccus sp.]